jgi:hypothetical protein
MNPLSNQWIAPRWIAPEAAEPAFRQRPLESYGKLKAPQRQRPLLDRSARGPHFPSVESEP